MMQFLKGGTLLYADVIYHIPNKVCALSRNIILPNLMEKLGSVQYSAALAMSGTWRGNSRVQLYTELGLEALTSGDRVDALPCSMSL